jgi:hypothetical protein
MKATEEHSYCDHCGDLIPETRKRGSLYCTNKCGWTYRNLDKAKEKKKLKEKELGLYKNYELIKMLYRNGNRNIKIETATELGMDFDWHMGIIKVDKENETTEFRLFEYSYTIYNDMLKIKKLTDECP